MIAPDRKRTGFTALELMGVLFVISLLIMILLPAVQQTRETARRVTCQNNLRQIGIALANYRDAFGVLPPGCVNPSGPIKSTAKGYHMSWLVQIQPHLGFPLVFRAMDFSESVYSQNNQAVGRTNHRALHCVSGIRLTNQSSYAGCHHHVEAPIDVDNQGVLFLNSSISLDDLVDGQSNTIFVGEYLAGPKSLNWQSGTRATLRNTGAVANTLFAANTRNAIDFEEEEALKGTLRVGSFGSAHSQGTNFLMGDGAVRFVSFKVDLQVLQRLANRNDGVFVGKF